MGVFVTIRKLILALVLLCIVFDATKEVLGSRRKMWQKKPMPGPVYTFVKTDKNANVKWGVRHYVQKMQ